MARISIVGTILSSLIYTAAAAPAMVWNEATKSQSEPVYTSIQTSPKEIFNAELTKIAETSDEGDLAMVFVLQRASNGADHLPLLTSSGMLPGLSQEKNVKVYSHVEGVEGPRSVLKDLQESEFEPVMMELSQVEGKLNGELPLVTGKKNKAKRRKLLNARTVVVNVASDVVPKELDEAVVKAIQHEKVSSVVLTSARSGLEMRLAKNLEKKRRLEVSKMKAKRAPRRRLEQGDDGNDNGNDDEGVYYVYMTPNILAGLLFTSLFSFVTFIGISCMGMIAGQDVYVSKMPPVGREA